MWNRQPGGAGSLVSDAAGQMNKVNASAVIVAYRSGAVIGRCLEALRTLDDVIVVDNAQDDDLERQLRALDPRVRYIRNVRNEGFGCAANRGIAAADHDFVLLVNPDAVLGSDCIDALLAAAEEYPEAALLAPTLYNPSGHVERSHDADLFSAKAMPRRRMDPLPDGDVCARNLSGAVLLIRRAPFQAIGGFDPEIFLFYEDDDLCLRLQTRGHALILVQTARAEHIGGASSEFRYRLLWRKYWHLAWSRLYIEDKYNGPAAAWREGIPLIASRLGSALLYALSFNRRKMVRDAARACGSAAALLGMSAQPREPKPDSIIAEETA